MKWNKEQQRAIDLRDCNILVSAGAGSGKTAVLTERIIRLIEQGASILDFAICTFTEDATMEMKNRIREKLIEKGLDKQADLVYMAEISTIHSLCQRIIKDNFDAISLPPKFTVLSNEAVLMEQAMDITLNTLFDDKGFCDFAIKFSPSDDGRIRDLLKDAYSFCMNIPDYREFLQGHIKMYENGDYSLIERNYCRIKGYELRRLVDRYNALAQTLSLTEKEQALVKKDMELLAFAEDSLKNGQLRLSEIEYTRMPPKAPNKDDIDVLRKAMKKLIGDICRYEDILDCDEILQSASKDLEMLLHGVTTFEETYSSLKLEKGYLTFNDMEQYAYRILQKEAVAEEYCRRYKYIFVDEYQDTSKLQQAILDRLRGEKNMFMVGDIKQSIYSFRNADPSMFHKVYNEYKDEGDNVKIDLCRNYRSSKNILDFVNGVFSVLLNISEQYYPKEAYLITEGKDDEASIEIDLLKEKEQEARQILRRIKECIALGYEPKDIAVLFRSLKTEIPSELYHLLRQEGIGADMSKGNDELYMESRVFIDTLSIIDNSDNDIPLMSVMYSQIGGFTIDDLIEIRKGKRGSFYSCAKEYIGNADLRNKLNNFFEMIEDFASRSHNMTVDELMSAVLMRTGYLKQVERQKDGRAKAGQIYHLIKSAKEFEAMGYYGISGFLEYFESLKQLKKAPEISGFVQGSNAVSIMTMHKSKGLEFPVVIIGDMNKQIHHKSEMGYYVFHKEMGIGLSHLDTVRRAKISTPMMELIKEQNTLETLEEQMRMLYVAMTRARERMYIVGSISDKELEVYERPLSRDVSDLLKGSATFLKALMLALGGGGRYNINRISIKDEIHNEDEKVVIPEYNGNVSRLLDSPMDTSTVIVPRKTAVTELTKDKEVFVPHKSKGKKKNNDGALAGTVTHNLLYHLRENEDFYQLMERMHKGEFFTEKELSLVDRDMIECFKKSALYKRICLAEKVYKEKPFIIELDETSGFVNETVMAQGIIDCVFEEQGEFVLVDYKTDNIVKNAEKFLREKYARQLELYAFAIESLTGKRVKERLIFHLRTGAVFSF